MNNIIKPITTNLGNNRLNAQPRVLGALCLSALLAAAPFMDRVMAADRVTLNEKGGFEGGDKRSPVEVNQGTRVKAVSIISGDRINRIILHGADGSVASFGGSKGAPHTQRVELNDGEYLVGFRGLCSDGRDIGPIPMRAGWFKVQAVFDGPNGRRYSSEVGTGGSSDWKIASGVKVTVGMKRFEILAPAGHEVVGLHGNAGAVLDNMGLITQKR